MKLSRFMSINKELDVIGASVKRNTAMHWLNKLVCFSSLTNDFGGI